VLYIPSTARPDYDEEGILLAKRPPSADGYYALPPPAASDSPVILSPTLVEGLTQRAELLLVAVSVYREPFDRNAIAFQLGQHDWTAARAPARSGPTPPYQAPSDLLDLLTECVSAGMLLTATGSQPEPGGCWQVEPWFASELHNRLVAAGRAGELVTAHRRAAEYWQWRAAAWPQDRGSDLNDLLEARHHFFGAGDCEQGSNITQVVCAQLHAWGDLSHEAELIESTLAMLPTRSASRAAWTHELGAIHQVRGEHGEAYRCYAGAVQMFALLGDYRGVARGQHSLGVLAQAQGDYRRAERHYKRSSAADRRAAALAAETGAATTGTAAAGTETTLAAATSAAAAGTGAAASAPPTTVMEQAAQMPAAPAAVIAAATVPQPAVSAGTATATGTSAAAAADTGTGTGSQPAAATQRRALRSSPPPRRTDPAQALRRAGRMLRRRSVLLPTVIGLGLTALTIVGIGAAMARTTPGPPADASSRTPLPAAAAPAGRARLAAAAWVATQVSRSAIVACDPAMCAALQGRGVPAGDLLALGSAGSPDPLGSNVIVATAAIRDEFGARLAAVYAPLVLARFGAGQAGIQIRAVAADGTAAFWRSWRSELGARRQFGEQLLLNSHLKVSGQAQAALEAGRVDSRLLMALATLADMDTLRIVSFDAAGPGASPAVPLRAVVIGPQDGAAASDWAAPVLRFLEVQQPPFRPSRVSRIHRAGPGSPTSTAQEVLIEFPSPSPLGLLAAAVASAGA
jgi:tetratricopeptide (TPR) repeat protein